MARPIQAKAKITFTPSVSATMDGAPRRTGLTMSLIADLKKKQRNCCAECGGTLDGYVTEREGEDVRLICCPCARARKPLVELGYRW